MRKYAIFFFFFSSPMPMWSWMIIETGITPYRSAVSITLPTLKEIGSCLWKNKPTQIFSGKKLPTATSLSVNGACKHGRYQRIWLTGLRIKSNIHFLLTLCQVQRPKTSMLSRGQNIPKHPVAIGKLRGFYTRKFPCYLVRISWIITVRDFWCFLLRHLHCLCVWNESESFWKLSRRSTLPVFEMGLFNNSDDKRF